MMPFGEIIRNPSDPSGAFPLLWLSRRLVRWAFGCCWEPFGEIAQTSSPGTLPFLYAERLGRRLVRGALGGAGENFWARIGL